MLNLSRYSVLALRVSAITVFILAASPTAWGQLTPRQAQIHQLRLKLYGRDRKVEFAQLLERLNLPSSTAIARVKSESLPAASTLKVYVYTGSHAKTGQAFRRSIETWNQKNGLLYGRLEVVPDILRADLILARFLEVDKATHEELSYMSWHPALAPGYSYLIVRKPEGLDVIYNFADLLVVTNEAPRRCLACERLFKLMKTRSKS